MWIFVHCDKNYKDQRWLNLEKEYFSFCHIWNTVKLRVITRTTNSKMNFLSKGHSTKASKISMSHKIRMFVSFWLCVTFSHRVSVVRDLRVLQLLWKALHTSAIAETSTISVWVEINSKEHSYTFSFFGVIKLKN